MSYPADPRYLDSRWQAEWGEEHGELSAALVELVRHHLDRAPKVTTKSVKVAVRVDVIATGEHWGDALGVHELRVRDTGGFDAIVAGPA